MRPGQEAIAGDAEPALQQFRFLFAERPSVGEWRGRYRFSTLVGFWFCGRVISYFGYLDAPQ